MIRYKQQPYVPTAFVPSHIDRQPVPDGSHRGVKDFSGVPTLPDWVIKECEKPLHDYNQKRFFDADLQAEADDAMAAIKLQLRQRMAGAIGGAWEGSDMPPDVYSVGRVVMVKPPASGQWIAAVVTQAVPLRVRTTEPNPIWDGCDFRPDRIRVIERQA